MFLTNHTLLPALAICALYKSQWQVELFFKWVKQHLRSSRVPQVVRFAAELPYNETGKLLRRKVRETLAQS